MARKMPTASAGNYRAPVDTAGMDPEMKETLGLGKKKPAAPSLGDRLRSMFNPTKRTSDKPVTKKGQGLQGNRKNTGSAGAY